MHLDVHAATAVVSIVSGDGFDFAWQTQDGAPALTDHLITAGGAGGRLVHLARAGSPMAFVSHWQSLFSNGSGTGLVALEEVANRVDGHIGMMSRWTTASELARLATAAAATTIVPRPSRETGIQRVVIEAPFSCPSFTVSMAGLSIAPNDVRTVTVRGERLVHQESDGATPTPLPAGCWTVRDGRVYVCWDIGVGETELSVAAA